jgi:hypothetical protein
MQPGEQTIRLLLDEPKDLRRIWLRFSEQQVERTQQFTLRWADSQTGPFREIVRQQWNFNPRNSTTEVEDYKVDLHHVLTTRRHVGLQDHLRGITAPESTKNPDP